MRTTTRRCRFVARARQRLDRLAHARGISAHRRSRRRAACGQRTRARSMPKPGSRFSATAATTSARAPRRSATTCWRCRPRAPTDMVAIQLDDRALFLTRWRDLLLELLDERGACRPSAARAGAAAHRALVRHALQPTTSAIASCERRGSQIRKDVFESLTALRAPALSGDEVHAVGAVRRSAVAARDAASGASARSALRLMGGGAARLARSRARRRCRSSARSCNAARGARATCCT